MLAGQTTQLYLPWLTNIMNWRLGKITGVKGTQVSVTYSVRGAKAKVPPMHTVQRSIRVVSIIYSTGDLMVNTREHFSALKELA